MRYFDSHAHYFDGRFATECPEGVSALLDRLLAQQVSGIVNVATSLDTARAAIAQAQCYPQMYTALGLHPTDCQPLADWEAELDGLQALIETPESKCVALGEIGLDYHYPDTDRQRQLACFHAQMQMAQRLSLPVVIHDRDAHGDVMEVLRAYPGVRGILHSFSGSAPMAAELAEMGYMISFSGTLTFTNARRPREAALAVPMEQLLIETDCPYLAPHPLRGTLNHSGNLSYTCATLAALRGVGDAEMAALTESNARRFLSLR